MKTNVESILDELPVKLRYKLMQFQKEGIEYAVNKDGRVLLADEMGLGKTIQAISIAYYYKEEWPLLIIVPSSLRYCWIEEIEKWLPDIHPHDINLIMMGNDAKNISKAKISIVTYGLLSKSTSHIVKEALTNQKFQVIICDESHYIKNSKTASSKAVVPLVQSAERRILLSGTPALAKPVELFPQLDALCPKAFGSWWDFTARYCDAKLEWFGRMKRRKVDGASNLEELQTKLVKMVMIRREKKDVLPQLPPKQRQKVLFELKDSELKKDIRSTFDDLKPKLNHSASTVSSLVPDLPLTRVDQGQITSDNKQDTTTLGLISKLLQLTGEAKVGPVKDYINMLIENENLKFLVFAYHHVMMNGIQQLLYEKKVKFIRIDGTVPPADRQMYVTQFQSDPSVKVAILSILAAGVGLTLTAAKLVVFAEMYWTPGVMVQCEDRAHRIGQTSCVPVHYLVAKGTMDEWVWSAVCKKTLVTSTTLSGKKQELEAESGDKYQVELLSNAEVNYAVEDENSDMDVSNYFQSQRPNDQKSILDFLTPPTSRNKSAVEVGKRKRNDSEELNISSSKKPKTVNQDIVILDSDSENEDFRPPVKTRTKLFDILRRDSEMSSPNSSPCNESRSYSRIDPSSPLNSTPSSPSAKSDEKANIMKSVEEDSGKVIKEPLTDPVQKNHWSCIACTYLNHQQLPYCEMCDSPKPNPKSVKKTFVKGDKSSILSSAECDKTISASMNDECDESNKGNKSDVMKYKSANSLLDSELPSIVVPKRQKNKIMGSEENVSADQIQAAFDEDFDEDFDEKIMNSDFSEVEMNIYTPQTKIMHGQQNVTLEINRDNSVITPGSSGKKYKFKAKTPLTPTNPGRINSNNKSGCSSRKPLFKQRTNSTENQACKDIPGPGSPLSGSTSTDLCDTPEKQQRTRPARNISDPTFNAVENSPSVNSHQLSPVKKGIGENKKSPVSTNKVLNISIPETIYKTFLYCGSRYTGRIYIFDENEEALNMNFVPLDIELDNIDDLPDLLKYRPHLRLVQKLVREWNLLTETKRRLLINRGVLFINPVAAYQQISSKQTSSTQRHKTKEDISLAAAKLASSINGTVRQISKKPAEERNKTNDESYGIAQVVNNEGVPLCLNCSQPYSNRLLTTQTITSNNNAWQTRFCSLNCADSHWTKTDSGYCRDKIYQIEHGVCQICQFDAHSFYKQVKDTVDMKVRVKLISESKFSKLKSKVKEVMTRKPVEGQFWHADHIKPVWEGGGMCDIDNIRTLCVLCHQKVTSQQASKRAQVKKLAGAASSGDITAFFQKI